MTAEQIIDKLRPTLKQEGLEVDFLGQEGSVVNIRAQRVGPGVPVAFLVKAIAGTYKRYLPEIEDVCLTEYDAGDFAPTAPSETFEPVFNHKPVSAHLKLEGIPVLDLKGLNRKDAVLAIEGFFKVWAQRSPLILLEGLTEDAPYRAAEKWAAVYREDYRELRRLSEQRWEIVLSMDSGELDRVRALGEEVMPGRIFVATEDG